MALVERSDSLSVASALANRATSDPNGVFLRGARRVTFGEVDSQAEALAAALSQLGVEPHDRIALVMPPCPEFVVSMFAAAKLGAVVVPLDPHLTPAELQYMLRHSEAVCAVTIEEACGVDFLQLFEDLLVGLPDLQYLVTVGEEDLWYDDRIFQYEDLLSVGGGRDYAAPRVIPEADCFAIVYTSGTTGKPKGVKLSHANLLQVAAGVAEGLALGADDRIAGVSALFHVFGLAPGVLSALLAGASLVLPEGPEDHPVLDLVETHRATILYGVPTAFVQAVRQHRAEPRDVTPLRLCLMAGAPVSHELASEVEEALAARVLVAYSVTETSSVLCMTRPDDPDSKRTHTVGRPPSAVELRILERDGGELPVESVGEIVVRGPGVMLGYYRQPRETRESFDPEGFLRTGDLGMIDEEGYLHLVGRRKEVIIRSGFNVYPREVEFRLEAHPAVQEAAVVGVPDPLLGEAVCACIVPVEGAIVTDREIVDWCRETLAVSKLPDLVRFFDELPRTGTGKIRRVELTRLAKAPDPQATS